MKKNIAMLALVIGFTLTATWSSILSRQLEYERTKDLQFEVMVDKPTGDIYTRLTDRPEDIARFQGMCPGSKYL